MTSSPTPSSARPTGIEGHGSTKPGRPVHIALLGPPGSGKTTQIATLQETNGVATIGAGNLLRDCMRRGTALGISARQYMDAGEMVPDDLIDAMMAQWIESQDDSNSIIFEGFPATPYQARFIDRKLRKRDGLIDAAIYLHVSDDEVTERLATRTVCPSCYRSYGVANPPKIEGQCDFCNEATTNRQDDVPDLIRKRLRVFHREIGPVLSHYHRSGRLRTLAADSSISQVAATLQEIVETVAALAHYAPDAEILERLGAAAGKVPRHDPVAYPARDIVLLGGPGSGKGTQSVQLCQKLNLPHISTGDLFRENLRKETELGKLAKTYMDRGELVPDDITESMVEERLSRPDTAKGFVLDGFPRSLSQAQALIDMLAGLNRRLSSVVYIDVSDQAITSRLSGRLICRECQAPFHRQFNPPQTEGRCDLCSGELYQRHDDNPETVAARLNVFHAETKPLIKYFEEADLVNAVNGEAAPDDVHRDIIELIESLDADHR